MRGLKILVYIVYFIIVIVFMKFLKYFNRNNSWFFEALLLALKENKIVYLKNSYLAYLLLYCSDLYTYESNMEKDFDFFF